MEPFLVSDFGNPSAIYSLGQKANRAVEAARKTVAEILHTQPDTIVFTSGGTESDNLAVLGAARAYGKKGHIISSAIEHEAVLKPLQALKKQGFDITLVPVDRSGKVNASDVIRSIRPDTVLVSVMYANNEIGTIEPIADIGRALLRYRKEHATVYPYFHTDACQAAGYLDLDVEKLHVDLMTLNGGKIYGPKGSGCLYIRRGVQIEPIMYGGSQERGLRGGTENVAGIVGFAKALSIVVPPPFRGRAKEGVVPQAQKTRKLAEFFLKNLKSKITNLKLNGPEIGSDRLPNNLNVQIPGIEGEALVLYLSEHGIMCSTGSACTAVTSEPSHVLKAIGLQDREITLSIRFSLGKTTTKTDVKQVCVKLNALFKILIY